MNDMIELFNKANQSGFETFRKLSDINRQAFQKLLEQQLDLTTGLVDVSMKHLDQAGKAKGYQELLTLQTDLLRDCSRKMVVSYKNGHEILDDARNSMTQLMDDSVKAAEETVRHVSTVAKKAA
ncbi:phasin family protein [Ectothiorhodospira lacustris]|uniref:phasin family protein n=1 Tax=Ectothiorhodospira lacustris TaxID=2899127 RepID=UPI001EE889D7|nr:phasin family protein [Ectothiorhodospira lacustris]MCG5500187.1 phasin family protein [Ectothiorhodospira lacustris]MCG5511314.1 phasin family protein [Ectothiorhodospira lacustris]MCG5523042.1 phasin family protein [Ectothiorhodospira lacustris]